MSNELKAKSSRETIEEKCLHRWDDEQDGIEMVSFIASSAVEMIEYFQSRITELESINSKLEGENANYKKAFEEIKSVNTEYKHYGIAIQTIIKKYKDENSI